MTRNVQRPRVRRGEEGHATAALGNLIALAGAIALGCASAEEIGWLAITAGIVLGIGILAGGVLHHRVVDYDIFARLDKLEKR
jgi:hypothetical protein